MCRCVFVQQLVLIDLLGLSAAPRFSDGDEGDRCRPPFRPAPAHASEGPPPPP